MDILGLIKKVLEVAGLKEAIGEEAVTFLEEFKPDDGTELEAVKEQLKESEAKAGRLLDQKKEAVSKADVAEAELEELKSSGLSDGEKLQKELDKEKAAREKAEADLKERDAKLSKTMRSHDLGRIASGVKFLDTVPEDMRAFAIEKAFAEIEDDDLSNAEKVKVVLDKFQEDHKGLIQAVDPASGSGGKGGSGGQGGAGSGGKKDPSEQSVEERQKHLTGGDRSTNRR